MLTRVLIRAGYEVSAHGSADEARTALIRARSPVRR